MIRAVANFFAGVIGIFIIVSIAAIAFGIKFATDINADDQALMAALVLIGGGVFALFSMGLSCVMLDIMFNVRKIAEGPKTKAPASGSVVSRTEPQFLE